MKRLMLYLPVALVVAGICYLILKPGDYVIGFKTRSSTGNVLHELRAWTTLAKKDVLKFTDSSQNAMVQEVRLNGKLYTAQWNVSSLNDSTTKVRMAISEPGAMWKNRLLMWFTDLPVEQDGESLAREFLKAIDHNLENFRVKINGETLSPEFYCACIQTSSTPEKKALQMMRNYNYISGFLLENNLKLEGIPMVKVLEYDRDINQITFNFCFPIKEKDSMPEDKDIFYQHIAPFKALKATFRGNYIHSNRAWYSMEDYALHHKLNMEITPLEVYHDNPNNGGDELLWTTEIYMPLIQE